MRAYARLLIDVLKDRLGDGITAGVEVGVWKGETSVPFLESFPQLTLYLVDAWEDCPPNPTIDATHEMFREAYQQVLERTRFAGDRCVILKKVSVEAAIHIPDCSLDFAFIDANHTYESVSADHRAWYPKVKAGGLYSGHDYGRWGVTKAVDELVREKGRKVRVDNTCQAWWFFK